MNKIEFIEKHLNRNTSDPVLIRLFFGKDPNIENILTLDVYCHLYFLDDLIIVDLFKKEKSEIIFMRNAAFNLGNQELLNKLYQILIYEHRLKVITEL